MTHTQGFYINDPIYGLVELAPRQIATLVNHSWVQRLRYIRQLGLSYMVFPSANHSRFEHSLGVYHLTAQALDTLSRAVTITEEERLATLCAALLHDIGHGPFSHALEGVLLPYTHEQITLAMVDALSGQVDAPLPLAKQILLGTYGRAFLCELVCSQLDMDRLDYLVRDSFFTGVSEGVVGYGRIIRLLTVRDEHLAIAAKALYSVERFLWARYTMFWQVYIHKTALAFEAALAAAVRRARQLIEAGVCLWCTPPLEYFLRGGAQHQALSKDMLSIYCQLTDMDVVVSVREWCRADDTVLAVLARSLTERIPLFVCFYDHEPVEERERAVEYVVRELKVTAEEASHLVMVGRTGSSLYAFGSTPITLVYKDGSVKDLLEAGESVRPELVEKPRERYYLCYPQVKLLK